jgi:hypothetical protein
MKGQLGNFLATGDKTSLSTMMIPTEIRAQHKRGRIAITRVVRVGSRVRLPSKSLKIMENEPTMFQSHHPQTR